MTAPYKLLSEVLNFPFQGTSLATGLDLMRETIPVYWRRPGSDPFPFEEHKTLDIYWQTGQEGQFQYDKNAMYLASCAGVMVGSGDYSHQRSPQFEAKTPGLWKIRLESAISPFDGRAAPHPTDGEEVSWQYTDMVLACQRLGFSVDVLEAYVFIERHQALRPWYERIRQARNALAPLDTPEATEARNLLKRLYTSSLGFLAHRPDKEIKAPLYHPDWYGAIIAHAKSRMFAHMQDVYEKTQLCPVWVKTDGIWYTNSVPLPVGPGIGQFKVKIPNEKNSLLGLTE